MSTDFFKIKKGVRLKTNTTTMDDAGEVKYDGSGNLVLRDGSAEKTVLDQDNSVTVTNKSIDSDNNTITNIVDADIKAAAAIDATKLADGSVTDTELQYINTLSSNAQTQLTTGASNLTTHESDTSTHGVAVAIAGTTDTQTLTNKTLTAPVVNSPTGIVKGDVGLGNVDNTSDATKDAATATLTNKTLTSPVINTPTGIVKGDVGLGNVDNTSDATKNAASVTITNRTHTSPVLNGTLTGTAFLDEDTMSSDSAIAAASQQSIKAYVDTNVSAAQDIAVVSKTATYTMLTTDYLVLADTSSAAFTLTLPTAVGNTGKQFVIKYTDSGFANACTIDGNASETIDGSTTTTLNTEGETLKIVSDGSNWEIIDRHIPSITSSYSPSTYNVGTTSSADAYWTRIGNHAKISFRLIFSANGSAGSAGVGLPSNVEIDNTVLGGNFLGPGSWFNASNEKVLQIVYDGANTDRVNFTPHNDGGNVLDGTEVLNGNYLRCSILIPISGWNG